MASQSEILLPRDLSSLPFINAGVTSVVRALDEHSVIKLAGDEDSLRALEVERRILERLGEHPRIVRLLYVHETKLVLERLLYPLLVRLLELRDQEAAPSTEEILKWSAQAAEGMEYFHGKNVLQIDIGSHNLLLDWDENIKYCDFSGSCIDGGWTYAAPSTRAQHPSISPKSPSVQSEIFALGSVLYEISTARRVYEDSEEWEFERHFTQGEYPETQHLLLGHVISKCWSGGYNNAGQVAAEIRAIQRRFKYGDLNLPLGHYVYAETEGEPPASSR
ncbi:hypothetical protein ABEF92_004607 [Exophiala dermatitidis]|uniref:Protein kinase domain-containing protein n=1 Tax=Exophiala dermatitidis (strain ATCC 34100 / CBS 525.76 / NIH/UT8656) TaxID=858893 RepID=H6CB23_EXODN|nr:uncharacterized protein HMPREF1120_08912 [Exophiala dermatitidis NIH/UT8656]EHY60970.1 hypothetical protein HMPREF1120_08912 [Exophiala dermatitidis NIH/UT8656]